MKKIAILLGIAVGISIIGTAIAQQARPRRVTTPESRFASAIVIPTVYGANAVNSSFTGTFTTTMTYPASGSDLGMLPGLNMKFVKGAWSETASGSAQNIINVGNVIPVILEAGTASTLTVDSVTYTCLDVRGNLRTETLVGPYTEGNGQTGARGTIACVRITAFSMNGAAGGGADNADKVTMVSGPAIYLPGLTKTTDILKACKYTAAQTGIDRCVNVSTMGWTVIPSEHLLDLFNSGANGSWAGFYIVDHDTLKFTYRYSQLP